jgi:hypothetical protein
MFELLATCSFKSVGRRRKKSRSPRESLEQSFEEFAVRIIYASAECRHLKPAPKLFGLPCYSKTGRLGEPILRDPL